MTLTVRNMATSASRAIQTVKRFCWKISHSYQPIRFEDQKEQLCVNINVMLI